MSTLNVERLGGFAGMGGMASHVRSRGELDAAALSPSEKDAVEKLFHAGGKTGAGKMCDGFRYRISRSTPVGDETIEVHESAVPAAIAKCVHDELV
jgi:hypothetical protein